MFCYCSIVSGCAVDGLKYMECGLVKWSYYSGEGPVGRAMNFGRPTKEGLNFLH
jgi:hypothetical protein